MNTIKGKFSRDMRKFGIEIYIQIYVTVQSLKRKILQCELGLTKLRGSLKQIRHLTEYKAISTVGAFLDFSLGVLNQEVREYRLQESWLVSNFLVRPASS